MFLAILIILLLILPFTLSIGNTPNKDKDK